MAHDTRAGLADFTIGMRVIPITLIAGVIGVICTGVAWTLLRLIAFFTNVFYYGRFTAAPASPAGNHLGLFAVLVPVAGGVIVGFMARYGTERIKGHGIPEAIEAILTRGSRVEPRVAVLKPLSAAIAIGSGGPFGAEGPIIVTGGAFGSLIAQRFHLTAAERKTLLVAGAAAGMSATFAAPVAATLLGVELLLFEWKPRSLIPVALASAVASACRPLILGAGPLFPTPPLHAAPSAAALLACVPVGLVVGVFAALLTLAVYRAEDSFPILPIHWMWWPAVGGLIVGIGGLISPRALGVGYDVIADLLAGRMVIHLVIALFVIKALIWAISLGSGTSGGVLAPLLMVGASLGTVLSPALPHEGVAFWPLVGMAAMLGGAMRVPLTAVIFALELTHDVNMLVPLMIGVVVSYAFTVLTMRRSILTEKVDRRGFHLSQEYSTDPLELLFVREVMSRDPEHLTVAPKEGMAVHPDEPLARVVNRMAVSGKTELLVVERDDLATPVGWISLEHLLEARARHVEEERRRDGSVPLSLVVPKWFRAKARRARQKKARRER